MVSGSALSSTAASGLIAGANFSGPEIRITIGLPAEPCTTGFIYIPPNGETLNSEASNQEVGFCVASVEAATTGTGVSFALGNTPTSQVARATASDSCSAFSVSSGVAKLPTNTQWQALANIVHWTKENWILGYPGYTFSSTNNYLLSGNNGSTTSSGSLQTSSTNPCYGTSSSSCTTSSYVTGRRTHYMGNTGSVIWDLGGNLSEWVSDSGPQSGSYTDILIAKMSKQTSYFAPLMSTSDYEVWDSSYHFGLGLVSMSSVPTNAGVVRGGSINDESKYAGVFRTILNYGATEQNSGVGFRCVQDLNPPGF